MKLLVVHWVVKYDEIWMKLLVVHWVVKYDEIWMKAFGSELGCKI
jgi:hypothetical protein